MAHIASRRGAVALASVFTFGQLLASCGGGGAAVPADIHAALANTSEVDNYDVQLADADYIVTLSPNEHLEPRFTTTKANEVEVLADRPGGKGGRYVMEVRGPGRFAFRIGAEWDDGDYDIHFEAAPHRSQSTTPDSQGATATNPPLPTTPPTIAPTTTSTLPAIEATNEILGVLPSDNGLSPTMLGEAGRFNWSGITSSIEGIAEPDTLTLPGAEEMRPADGQRFLVLGITTPSFAPSLVTRTLLIDGKRLAMPDIVEDTRPIWTALSVADDAASVQLEYRTIDQITTYDLLGHERAPVADIFYANPNGREFTSNPGVQQSIALAGAQNCTMPVSVDYAALEGQLWNGWEVSGISIAAPGRAFVDVHVVFDSGNCSNLGWAGPTTAEAVIIDAAGNTYPVTFRSNPAASIFDGWMRADVPETFRSGTLHIAPSIPNETATPAVIDAPLSFGN